MNIMVILFYRILLAYKNQTNNLLISKYRLVFKNIEINIQSLLWKHKKKNMSKNDIKEIKINKDKGIKSKKSW